MHTLTLLNDGTGTPDNELHTTMAIQCLILVHVHTGEEWTLWSSFCHQLPGHQLTRPGRNVTESLSKVTSDDGIRADQHRRTKRPSMATTTRPVQTGDDRTGQCKGFSLLIYHQQDSISLHIGHLYSFETLSYARSQPAGTTRHTASHTPPPSMTGHKSFNSKPVVIVKSKSPAEREADL